MSAALTLTNSATFNHRKPEQSYRPADHTGSALMPWPWPLIFWSHFPRTAACCRGLYICTNFGVGVDSSGRFPFRALQSSPSAPPPFPFSANGKYATDHCWLSITGPVNRTDIRRVAYRENSMQTVHLTCFTNIWKNSEKLRTLLKIITIIIIIFIRSKTIKTIIQK